MLLGEPSVAARSRDMTRMLEQGFADLEERAGELRTSGAPSRSR